MCAQTLAQVTWKSWQQCLGRYSKLIRTRPWARVGLYVLQMSNLHNSLVLWAGPSHPLGTEQFAPKVCLAATADVPPAASGHSHNLSPLWYLMWNSLIDNARSLRKAHTGEEDYTSSLTRTTGTVRPQCGDFMLPSSLKAGGKLGMATSISYKPGEPQGGLSLKCMWLGHADHSEGQWIRASFTNLFAEHQ